MKLTLRQLTTLSGLSGAGIVVLGSLITALPYEGRYGQSYSLLNHFVSELGEMGVSAWAPVFNVSMIAGGVLLALFMIGLALLVRRRLFVPVAVFGVVSAVAVTFVGLFPMDQLGPHIVAASTFFTGGLLLTIAFTLYLAFVKQPALPRWLIIPGALTALSFAVFRYVPHWVKPVSENLVQDVGDILSILQGPDRPPLQIYALLEWSVFFSIIAWIALTAWAIRKPAQNANTKR